MTPRGDLVGYFQTLEINLQRADSETVRLLPNHPELFVEEARRLAGGGESVHHYRQDPNRSRR